MNDESLNDHDDIMAGKIFLHIWPFVRGIHWWPVDSPHKGPVMFLCCQSAQVVEQTVEWVVILDTMTLVWCYNHVLHDTVHISEWTLNNIIFMSNNVLSAFYMAITLLLYYELSRRHHDLETLSVLLLALCVGNPPLTHECPKCQLGSESMFLSCQLEQAAEQTIEWLVILDAMTLTWCCK